MSKYVVHARLLVEADSKRDAITTAAGAIDPTREAVWTTISVPTCRRWKSPSTN